MKEIYLSREIENNDGYIDSVINEIKGVPSGEELQMLITCVGGDTFQGDRIYRAILEHSGKTSAVVVGCAISMGASILPAFDKVLIDEGAEIMLHKANIPTADGDYNEEQKGLISRFNSKTFQRMSDMGVDPDFLESVFLSDEDDNYWLTPKEAEGLGIGVVVSADRNKLKNQFAIAAKLDVSQIKLEKGMNLFKKAVPRVVNLADGRQALFSSKSEELKVGDSLTLIGGEEKLTGEIKLENNLMLQLSDLGLIENMEEVVEEEVTNEVSDDMFAELQAQVEELRAIVTELVGEKEGAADAAEVEAKKDEEIQAKEEEVEAKAQAADDLLKNAMDLASTIKSSFKVPTIEDKTETVQNQAFEVLTESEKRAHKMKEILNTK